MGEPPWFQYNIDGNWRPEKYWLAKSTTQDQPKTRCVPWPLSHQIINERMDTYKLHLGRPLMRGGNDSTPGASLISFWMRNEDWRQANDKAPIYE